MQNMQNIKLIFTTFSITYWFLILNLVVSFIFSIFYPKFRGVFVIEVIISIIAAVIYYYIIQTANSAKNVMSIDWKKITDLRYIDWSMTTPLMLVSLSLFLNYGEKIANFGSLIAKLIFFDIIMILSGYLGEINYLSNSWSLIIGFISYFIIFYLIYANFISKLDYKLSGSFIKLIIFLAYAILWCLYGVIYDFSIYSKNLITNILDCIAKAFIGLFFAFYILTTYQK